MWSWSWRDGGQNGTGRPREMALLFQQGDKTPEGPGASVDYAFVE